MELFAYIPNILLDSAVPGPLRCFYCFLLLFGYFSSFANAVVSIEE